MPVMTDAEVDRYVESISDEQIRNMTKLNIQMKREDYRNTINAGAIATAKAEGENKKSLAEKLLSR